MGAEAGDGEVALELLAVVVERPAHAEAGGAFGGDLHLVFQMLITTNSNPRRSGSSPSSSRARGRCGGIIIVQ